LQRTCFGVDAHKWVKRPHTLVKVRTRYEVTHGLAQVLKAGLVQYLHLGQCAVGVGVLGGAVKVGRMLMGRC
jgi:hypothetical protein